MNVSTAALEQINKLQAEVERLRATVGRQSREIIELTNIVERWYDQRQIMSYDPLAVETKRILEGE